MTVSGQMYTSKVIFPAILTTLPE